MSCVCDPARPCRWCESRAEERAEERELGDPMTERDWNDLEAGRFWNSYPGMGAA